MVSDIIGVLKTITPKVFFMAPPVQIGDSITIDGHPMTLDYPYVVYREVSDVGIDYADNTEQASAVTYSVSIMNNDDTNAVADEIIKAMRSIGFERTMKLDLYQDGEFAKVMQFKGGRING